MNLKQLTVHDILMIWSEVEKLEPGLTLSCAITSWKSRVDFIFGPLKVIRLRVETL